ncbi:MAG: dihydrodipicolinate synthase family protein [Puniceicoccales bacterium]
MSQLHGVYCPNLVPFHEDRSINEAELERLTEWLIEKGVSGLYPNGSTGEFIRLTFEERLRVVEIMAKVNRGRLPILAGAAEGNIDLILQAAQHYADLGCRAISVTGPYYFNVKPESVEYFFREIARQSPLDIVLYNIPQFSSEIPIDSIYRLAMDCENIIGIKDSSRDMPAFVNLLHKIKPQRPDFSILVGCEEILFPTLLMGGDGGTVATSGVVPEVVMKLYERFQAGDFAACRKIQLDLLDIINPMLKAGNFPDGFRAGAELRGIEVGPPRQPLDPLDNPCLKEAQQAIRQLLRNYGLSATSPTH